MFKKLRKKYGKKFRIVAQDEHSYSQKWSFRTSNLRLFLLFFFGFVLIIVAGAFIGKQWSGFGNHVALETEENVLKNNKRIDSLKRQLIVRDYYLNDLKKVIKGERFADSMIHLNKPKSIDSIVFDFSKSNADSLLKLELEQDRLYAERTITTNDKLSELFFFSPLTGVVSQSFNKKAKHFGVDVVANENETIKATLSGYVIYAGWTQNDGYVMIINHKGGLISIYKHNSSLLKSEGEKVEAGDPIAIIGNSGELSSGFHLHFELWWDGQAINPQDYISFY